MLIELTNKRFEKFWLNATLVTTIEPRITGSQINLTTGGYVVCLESNRKVAEKILLLCGAPAPLGDKTGGNEHK